MGATGLLVVATVLNAICVPKDNILNNIPSDIEPPKSIYDRRYCTVGSVHSIKIKNGNEEREAPKKTNSIEQC